MMWIRSKRSLVKSITGNIIMTSVKVPTRNFDLSRILSMSKQRHVTTDADRPDRQTPDLEDLVSKTK